MGCNAHGCETAHTDERLAFIRVRRLASVCATQPIRFYLTSAKLGAPPEVPKTEPVHAEEIAVKAAT